MMRSLSTSAFGQPSETKAIFGAERWREGAALETASGWVASTIMRLLATRERGLQAQGRMVQLVDRAKRPGPFRAGFSTFRERSGKGRSVFGDGRSRRREVEFVAETGLDAVLCHMAVNENAEAQKPDIGREYGRLAEIGIAIFGADRPIAGDGIFEAPPIVQPTRALDVEL